MNKLQMMASLSFLSWISTINQTFWNTEYFDVISLQLILLFQVVMAKHVFNLTEVPLD